LTNAFPQDTNREVVLPHFTKITDCLAKEELRKTALAVLYNLGQDFGEYHVIRESYRMLTKENLRMHEQLRLDSIAPYHGYSQKVPFLKTLSISP
jgi:hypothetical protein